MPRYFTRQRGYVADDLYDSYYPLLADIHVPDHVPVNTGLLDANGDAIMRAPRPIGFGRMEDW